MLMRLVEEQAWQGFKGNTSEQDQREQPVLLSAFGSSSTECSARWVSWIGPPKRESLAQNDLREA
jgi:hypothetical protein